MCDENLTSSTCACACASPVAPPAPEFWDVLNVYKMPRDEDEWKKSLKLISTYLVLWQDDADANNETRSN